MLLPSRNLSPPPFCFSTPVSDNSFPICQILFPCWMHPTSFMISNIPSTPQLQLLTRASLADDGTSPLACLSCHQLIVSMSNRPACGSKTIPSSIFPIFLSLRIAQWTLFSFDPVLPSSSEAYPFAMSLTYVPSTQFLLPALQSRSWLLCFGHYSNLLM